MTGDRGGLRRVVRANPYAVAAVGVAIATGMLVYGIAVELFPYHSLNHDEGVYLQQAALLLDGRLFLTPGSDALREAFHPWFFVEGDRGLYSKYAPVPAAVFAAGRLLGDYRFALAGVAMASIVSGYALATMAFDRRTGLLAAVIMAASPLFLLNAAVFLPYVVTTALNLLFAVAYVRSVRRGDRWSAAVAGAAIGLAFFARPYTAVLFAVPFVLHAVWRLVRAWPDDRRALSRTMVTAGFGLALVAVTLAYNVVTTGSAFLFPYEAFAPRDGIGFGRRALLGHEVQYTPMLGLQANATVLWTFATSWFAAGLIGTGAAAVGVTAVVRGTRTGGLGRRGALEPRRLRLVLLGVMASVVIGNLAFWGNYNLLGTLADPADGFIGALGPFYHFDLLLPLAAFAAHGVLTIAESVKAVLVTTLPARSARIGMALMLVVSLVLVGTAAVGVVAEPVDRNAAHTEKLSAAYEPFETTDLTQALIFLPPTYGEWRNHPFQWLRNEPGFDGPTVYALARNPADDFAVIDAYPERSLHRYRYHGVWNDEPGNAVIPLLERQRVVSGDAVTARTTVAVPDRIIDLRVAVRGGGAVQRYDYRGELPSELAVDWSVSRSGVSVAHPNLTSSVTGTPVRIDRPTELMLTITITEPGGGTLTYRDAILVRPTDNGVELLWPPASSACPLVTDCGNRGTYLPERPDTRPPGVEMQTTLNEVTG